MEFHFVGLIYTTYRNLFLRITNNVIMVRNTSIFANKLGLNFMKYLSLWIRFCLEIILVVTKICFSLDFIFLDRMKNYFCWNLISWIYPFFVKTQKKFLPTKGWFSGFLWRWPCQMNSRTNVFLDQRLKALILQNHCNGLQQRVTTDDHDIQLGSSLSFEDCLIFSIVKGQSCFRVSL